METGEKLRLLRKNHGLSKKDVGKQAGISGYYVGKLEEGKSKPSIEVASKLAKTLGVNLEYIARGVLDDFDIINIDGVPLRMIGLEKIKSDGRQKSSEWDLKAPSVGHLKTAEMEGIVKKRNWSINLTGESTVYLARTISKLISKKEIDAIVALSPRTGVVAGALSAVLYEKRETQITSIIIVENDKEKLFFTGGPLRSRAKVVLIDEVTKRTDRFVKVVDEIRSRGCEIIAVIAIIDLLEPKDRKHILSVLPEYKFVFSAGDIGSVLESNKR